jgi:hypothetical protein
MSLCKQCQKNLTNDEIGVYKKLVNRGATEYLCKQCLADFFHCEIRLIDEKIVQFKQMGCALFAKEE